MIPSKFPPPLPRLTLNSEAAVDVPYVGGTYTIAYTLENVTDKRPYADSSCDWITVLSHTSTEAEIKVEPLVDEPRTGKVTLSYPESDDIVVTFNQKAAGTFTESISLSIEEITMTSAKVVVSNPYEDYWVCPRVETKTFYDSQIAPDPEKWIATYCNKASSTGMFPVWRNYYYENFNNNPLTFPEYYSISKEDGNSHSFTNLKPETAYVAFGIEVDPFCIATGEIEALDCGVVNGLHFVNIFSFGIFTTTSQRTPDERKHRFGKLAYIMEGIKELRHMHAVPLHVRTESEEFDFRALMTLVFNGETAGGFRLANTSSVRDGMFDCILLEKRNFFVSCFAMLRYLCGGHPRCVRHLRAATLQIASPVDEPTDVDGQQGARFPLDVRCLPGLLRVVCPRNGGKTK